MAKKLWQKGDSAAHEAVTRYMTRGDIEADQRLVAYDILGSIAHAKMLEKSGLLTASECKAITGALDDLIKLYEKGEFILSPEDEDMHTAIENYLVEQLGDAGKKIHAGRSRNDQVLTAVRLFAQMQVAGTYALLKDTAETILKFAKSHEFVPMPGFTHMQHAMPSSVGQWAGAFVESLLDDAVFMQAAYTLNDQNPLGSAAGFGTAIEIDREMTAKLLGFGRVQVNALYCQNSRGKIEAATISALMQVMMSLGKIANDLIIFTSQEFSFFKVEDSLTTGSSIMPQKRNLDIMEVLRANVSVMQSLQIRCQSAALNLISGYNKDLMVTKAALIEAFEICQESLKIIMLVFQGLEPREDKLLAAFDDTEIYAADYANKLVGEGMTFRDAYRQVGENLSTLEAQDPVENIRGKTHIGAPGNLCLDLYEERLKNL